jgi:hypothetical protein
LDLGLKDKVMIGLARARFETWRRLQEFPTPS